MLNFSSKNMSKLSYILLLLNTFSLILTNPFPLRILISCQEGYYLSGSQCYQCPPGKYSPKGNNACMYCPAGTYTDYYGASKCKKCPDGTYSSDDGMSYCKICEKGRGQVGLNLFERGCCYLFNRVIV